MKQLNQSQNKKQTNRYEKIFKKHQQQSKKQNTKKNGYLKQQNTQSNQDTKKTPYSKYSAKKVTLKIGKTEFKFDSQKEANRFNELYLLLKSKKIKDLVLQPEFLLQEGFIYQGKKERAIYYISDFQYFDIETNKIVVEDVKGFKTDVYRLKRKLFLAKFGENYDFREL